MCAKDNSHATSLFPFQKVPPLSSSTTKVTAKLLATPLGTRSMKIFSPAFCDLLFSAFFCGWKTYLPVGGRVGRIWPVAIFLLEKSHGDVGTLETSWSALSSRVFLNLTCEVPANKQGQIPVMPLWVVAPGTRHSVGLHFSTSVGTVFF